MMNTTIEIKVVESLNDLKKFVQFYYDLYRDCEQAVPFLFSDEMNTLRKDRNPSFECCEACYFMAWRNGQIVGRIAAIINHRANEKWNCKVVRFDWFDFIDDEKPLYVDTDEAMNITGFLDDDRERKCKFISGGIYGLTPSAFATLDDDCIDCVHAHGTCPGTEM